MVHEICFTKLCRMSYWELLWLNIKYQIKNSGKFWQKTSSFTFNNLINQFIVKSYFYLILFVTFNKFILRCNEYHETVVLGSPVAQFKFFPCLLNKIGCLWLIFFLGLFFRFLLKSTTNSILLTSPYEVWYFIQQLFILSFSSIGVNRFAYGPVHTTPRFFFSTVE